MKNKYQAPEMLLIRLDEEDVISTSGTGDNQLDVGDGE